MKMERQEKENEEDNFLYPISCSNFYDVDKQ
jgi:hypothetical protein